MYYGHGSWIVLLLLGGVFVLRAVSSRRRRAPGGPTASKSSFVGPDHGRPGAGPAPGFPGTGSSTYTGVAPGWFIDPSGRHEQRYWSGTEWTEHVTDGGAPGIDPPPRRSGQQSPG